jgi:hypothetical protein
MNSRSSIFDENPSVEGPDYVALVIEWDELADDLDRQLRTEPSSLVAAPQRPLPMLVKLAASAMGAMVLWRMLYPARA